MSRSQSLKSGFAFLCGDVIVLTIAFALLVIAARLIGSTQPPPEALQELHLTDCALPCWLGIVPGQTRFEEAVRRVSAAYPLTGADTFSAIGVSTISAGYKTPSSFGQAVIQVDTHHIVRQITLMTSDANGLRMGDIVNFYGTPACVSSAWPSVVYGETSTFAFLNGTMWIGERWLSPLNNIDIRGYGSAENPCTILTLSKK